jgi:hypothetical protein
MAYWRLLLLSFSGSLADAACLCSTPSLSIVRSIDGYHLRSTEFELLDDPVAVYDLAQERVAQVNGIARLALKEYCPIRLAPSVSRMNEDGTGKVWVFRTPAEERPQRKGEPSEAATAIAPSVFLAWMASAREDEAMTQALRLFSAEQHDWTSLYKVLELARSHMNQSIEGLGIASASELRRFTQTANSAESVGDSARHSRGRFAAPRNPMSLPEASELLGRILRAWLQFTSSHSSH